MTPYSGPWTAAEAAHLLRRCTFGATFTDIQAAVQAGMSATISNLLIANPIDEPLAYDPAEQIVAQGQTWYLLFIRKMSPQISRRKALA